MADELVKQLGGFAGTDAQGILGGASSLRPSDEELSRTHVAVGRKAMLHLGIAYHGPWKFFGDGMGRHTREQVKALATTGLPIRLQAIGHPRFLNEELQPEVREVEYLERVSFSHTALAIKQLIFHDLSTLREQICPSLLRGMTDGARVISNTIVYTSWERDKVFSQYIQELKQCAQVWVPCESNKRAFVESGMPEAKVAVIPYPYDPNKHLIAAPRGREDVPKDLRFYHIGKWEPRKNQYRMIGAFLLAFTPKDRASLLIKTSSFGSNWAGYPGPEEAIQLWKEDEEVKSRGWTDKSIDRLIRIIQTQVSDEDIQTMHAKNNIYISCGHGEAWDIPAFDAKLAGNRLVYMGYGGPEDYAEPEDIKLMTHMKAVHSQYDWEQDAQWGDVSVEHFAEKLREAKPPEVRVCPLHYAQKYSYSAVGRKMEREIEKLLGSEQFQTLKASGGFG